MAGLPTVENNCRKGWGHEVPIPGTRGHEVPIHVGHTHPTHPRDVRRYEQPYLHSRVAVRVVFLTSLRCQACLHVLTTNSSDCFESV